MDETPVAPTTAKRVATPSRKSAPKRVVDKGEQRPYMQASLADDASSLHRVAFAVLAERSDVLPSVERIIHGCPDEDTAERALVLFHHSLTGIGDPNRNPQTAIAAAMRGEGAA